MAIRGAWFEMPRQVELLSNTKLTSHLVVMSQNLVLKTSLVEVLLVQSIRHCAIFLEGQRITTQY